jgi:hypothetical protein
MISFRPLEDHSQVVDALTGAALREGATRCACGVFYNRESVLELEASNDAKCAACERPVEGDPHA